MKPPRSSIFRHAVLRSPKSIHVSPLSVLVSSFLSLDSPLSQRTPDRHLKKHGSPCMFSKSQYIGNAGLFNSLKQSESVIKTYSERQVQSPNHHDNGAVDVNFFGLSQKSKPVTETALYGSTLPAIAQVRSFSTGPSDPFPRTSDFMEPNSSVVSTVASPFEGSPPIDAGSSIRKPISLWPGIYHSPATNALWEARSSIFERPSNTPTVAPAESEIITKTPSQSRTSILYNFSNDYILREQYRNPWNEIRMGKLLEDLDALAGTVSYKHCCNNDGITRPLLLVTASVDRMVLKKPICVDIDMKITGAVTWVGRSSMEIQLEVTQSSDETSKPSDSIAVTANFTFVARDSETGKSAVINKILPETEQEKLLWREAEERNKMRKQKRGQHSKEIGDGEVGRLKELLAEGRIFCDMPALADRDSILMRDTCLQNSLICQPQQRNIYGRIFGGFLMRRAFEIAFATAYAFAGSAPNFLEVDHVDFLRPVDVGNFLRLKSCVLYTELDNSAQPLINVEVIAHVTRPDTDPVRYPTTSTSRLPSIQRLWKMD